MLKKPEIMKFFYVLGTKLNQSNHDKTVAQTLFNLDCKDKSLCGLELISFLFSPDGVVAIRGVFMWNSIAMTGQTLANWCTCQNVDVKGGELILILVKRNILNDSITLRLFYAEICKFC